MLSKVIECLMKQGDTGSLIWELIIIDNNSSDEAKADVSDIQKGAQKI